MADFTHLHVHTQYSFLDGAIHMHDLVPRIQELGMKACAITDHANMFGAIDFYRRARAAGTKPILGMEAYVADTTRHDRSSRRAFHLVLIAKNAEGWSNLTYLSSMGYREGFYHRPRIDKELLRERSKGLFALSGCLGGEVSQSCIAGDLDRAREVVREHKAIFEPEHYFLELQETGLDEQRLVNEHLSQLARDESVPIVASNNCHYKMRSDAAAHDVLLAIQHGKSVNDPTRRRQRHDAFYIRSAEEMATLFRGQREAIDNTQRIVEQIDLELALGKPMLPTFVPDDGSDLETYLRERTRKGLGDRLAELPYAVDRDTYAARLESELQIIIDMKFPGYFLIVADFINWAKKNDIPVGPGRGSGAGSLVAFALRITDLDPIPYNLLFERFLNPERVSMPDFDVDFCQERRHEVIEYVTGKYGSTKVGQIATFAQLKAKSVIKDVARSLEVPFNEVNELTKLLPNTYKDDKGNVKPITIEKALEMEPRLRSLQDEKPVYRKIIEIAEKLEGLYRQAGMHAAGIVIADSDLWDAVPVFYGNDGELITQFSMADVEDAGLVKFDFLGLKTLDVIFHAESHVNRRVEEEAARNDYEALIRHRHLRRTYGTADALEKAKDADLELHMSRLALDDPDVYRLISKGETLGVFQLESTGFQELLRRLKPDCFEDIVAAVALYRPGPLQTGMVDDFIDCKHKRIQVRYPHPLLEEVLKPTYGGFVYQEQVMQAAQVMAGYSLGGADLLRRAMGKKKAEVMAKERSKFVAGCTVKGISERASGEVFDLMEKFAGYGFNKSHSAAYALITFQTAYLKTYYPTEFMAALLTTESSHTENIVKYIGETRSMHIEVLPPTVNESEISFTVAGNRIRFGLGAVKGLGEAALGALLEARKSGPFTSLYDFCERVPLDRLNKKTLETLVRSGAFDCFGRPRAQLSEALERAIEAARGTQRAEAAGQASLFSAPALAKQLKPKEIYSDQIPEWPELERLHLEKGALGFYVSGHPLDRYADDSKRLTNCTIAQLESKPTRSEVFIACVVTSVREVPLKDGSGRLAFVGIEDRTGATEIRVPQKMYEEIGLVLKSDVPILLQASVFQDRDEEGNQLTRIRVAGAKMLSDARKERTKGIVITIPEERADARRLDALGAMLKEARDGGCSVRIVVHIPAVADVEMRLPSGAKLEASDHTVDRVEQLFGVGSARFW
jgi:DNA polymerase-3 subunit alpha